MLKRSLALSFAASLLTSSAFAGTEAEMDQLLSASLEELMAMKVKIATSTEKALSKAPSVVTIITADDIKATGATNFVEILQSVPGIYIRTNGFGFRPWITFRGASSAHTLLMINGAPIKDLVFASGAFWKGLPTTMIERIEIIRGPGSALYGSDASAGVVNVITKTAARIDHSEAGARAGSFDSRSGWLQHGTEWNGFDIGLTANVSHTSGYGPFIAADRQTASDRTGGTRVSYAPTSVDNGYGNQDLRFSAARGNWRLNADYMRLDDLQTGLSGGAVIDPLTRGGNHRYNVDLFYNNALFAQDWSVDAELRFLHLDYSTGDGTQERPPGFGGAYPQGQLQLQRAAENRVTFETSGLYTGFRQHAIRVGAGYVVQDLYSVQHLTNFGIGPDGKALPNNGPLVDLSGTPYAFAPERSRRIAYEFLQDTWTVSEDWELTLGLRRDRYSDFGGTTDPRLALVWQTTERLVSKLMYGEAFRAPSYLELYSATAASVGNPALKPERSKTLDMSFSYLASHDLQLGVDLYRFTQSNLIGMDAANKYQNVAGDLSAHGIELEARWQATPTLRVTGSASNRVEDYSPLRSFNVPKQTSHLRADWAFLSKWNWDVQATRIGAHLLPAAAPTPIGAYVVVDTTLRYAHGKAWEFAASIRNLSNADVREYVGNTTTAYLPYNLPLPGRNYYIEARFKY